MPYHYEMRELAELLSKKAGKDEKFVASAARAPKAAQRWFRGMWWSNTGALALLWHAFFLFVNCFLTNALRSCFDTKIEDVLDA